MSAVRFKTIFVPPMHQQGPESHELIPEQNWVERPVRTADTRGKNFGETGETKLLGRSWQTIMRNTEEPSSTKGTWRKIVVGNKMENRRNFSNRKGLKLRNSEPEANISQFGSWFQSHILAHEEIQPFKTIQGFVKEMACCFFACLPAPRHSSHTFSTLSHPLCSNTSSRLGN